MVALTFEIHEIERWREMIKIIVLKSLEATAFLFIYLFLQPDKSVVILPLYFIIVWSLSEL